LTVTARYERERIYAILNSEFCLPIRFFSQVMNDRVSSISDRRKLRSTQPLIVVEPVYYDL